MLLSQTAVEGEMPHVLFEKRDGIAYVTLNRPGNDNAFSAQMCVRLVEIWDDIAADSTVRVVVLTAAGDAMFSPGVDEESVIPLMRQSRPPVGHWEQRFAADRTQLQKAMLRNASFFKPVIAAVNGHALGAGSELLLATDLRVVSEQATFGLTEASRGLVPASASLVRLARQVAWAHAMEIILTGEPISARRALEIGLVNRVVPPEAVMPAAVELAQRINLGAPTALAKSKEAVVRSNGLALDEAFMVETECTKANARTDDAKEGPRAFMEKRAPVFTGE